jgi:CelD/BcsL family acetyltransferase involved in cellulose biosynthesis
LAKLFARIGPDAAQPHAGARHAAAEWQPSAAAADENPCAVAAGVCEQHSGPQRIQPETQSAQILHKQAHAQWMDARSVSSNTPENARLEAAWHQLAACAAEPNPFCEYAFILASVRHLPFDYPVSLLLIWDQKAADATLLGIIPMTTTSHYGRLRCAHVTNWQHANAFLGTPLVRDGAEERFWLSALHAVDAWPSAKGLIHFTGLVDGGPVYAGLQAAAAQRGQRCDIVLREARAALIPGSHNPETYWAAAVRSKKRKELRRQAARLAEMGAIAHHHGLPAKQDINAWIAEFIALEQAGWKGQAGSALGDDAGKADFFAAIVTAAFAEGRADLRSITLDNRPIAMLVHLFAGDTAFSFKTAFDENLARFSPGVLIQQDNLALMRRPGLALIDSCAAPNHPMINSLWMERRSIIRVSLPLRGAGHALRFATVRLLEEKWSQLRRILARKPNIMDAQQQGPVS